MGFFDFLRRVGKQIGNFFKSAGKLALKVFRGALRVAGKAIPIASAIIGVAKQIPGLGLLAAQADSLLDQVKNAVKVGQNIDNSLGQIGV